jgi:hypothetical protein
MGMAKRRRKTKFPSSLASFFLFAFIFKEMNFKEMHNKGGRRGLEKFTGRIF